MKSPICIPTVLIALAIISSIHAKEATSSNWMSKAGYGLMAHYEVFGVDKISPKEYNRRVNSFNVDSFVKQVKESGTEYVILTLGQNSGYYCAPNRTYDKLLGIEPGQKTATRDLPLELGKALQKENIRLVLYLPSRAPQRDRKTMNALGDTPQNKPAPQVFIKNWSHICQEWSERYGKLVSGWWFDGYYIPAGWANLQAQHNWKTWAEAVRAGNSDAELAFNRGASADVAFIRLNGAQTYTAGEATQIGATPKTHPPPEGMTWQLLTYLGHTWGKGTKPRYGADELIPYLDKVNALGGSVTFDVPLSSEGAIPESFMTVLRKLGKKHKQLTPLSKEKRRQGSCKAESRCRTNACRSDFEIRAKRGFRSV